MKVGVSSAGTSLDSKVDPRFGRCPYFLIVDTETMQFDAVPNAAIAAAGGAGIQAAKAVADRGVRVLITGNVGPNAYEVLSEVGIKLITGNFGTVRETIELYKRGELKETNSPTVGGHHGMGGGRGGGPGAGGGGTGARGPKGN